MTRVDVNTFLGAYPFHDTGAWNAAHLLQEMDRLAISESWISSLPAVFARDPAPGNAELYLAAQAQPRLRPVPAVHPGLPGWQDVVREAGARQAPGLRCDPTFRNLAADSSEMRALLALSADQRLPLMMAVRLEDIRQRHPDDVAPELSPAMIRTLIRHHAGARLIITHADREFVEQVHFGSTPDEASRILWDISWIWGPPEDHLELLLGTVGLDRFTFGTGTPLRLPEASIAKLDLLELGASDRHRIECENLRAFCGESR
jgi:predicted TIM-barrel fold metal-dependent hydrolase